LQPVTVPILYTHINPQKADRERLHAERTLSLLDNKISLI